MTQRKQFCKRGHDTAVIGRTSTRNCRACEIERNRDRRANNPTYRKQQRDFVRDYQHEKYQTDPEWRERRLKAANKSKTKNCPAGSTCMSHQSVIRRCTQPKSGGFNSYGGRFGKHCLPLSWRGRGGLKRFIADVGERPGPDFQLHRPCVDKGYSKSNAVWSVDHSEKCPQRTTQRPKIQFKKVA